jgi:hypothetical protein
MSSSSFEQTYNAALQRELTPKRSTTSRTEHVSEAHLYNDFQHSHTVEHHHTDRYQAAQDTSQQHQHSNRHKSKTKQSGHTRISTFDDSDHRDSEHDSDTDDNASSTHETTAESTSSNSALGRSVPTGCSLNMVVIGIFFVVYLVLVALVGLSLLFPWTILIAVVLLLSSMLWIIVFYVPRASWRQSVLPTMVFEQYVTAFVLDMPLVVIQSVVSVLFLEAIEFVQSSDASDANAPLYAQTVWPPSLLTPIVVLYVPLYAFLFRVLPPVVLVHQLLCRLRTNREPLQTRYEAKYRMQHYQ